MNFDDTPQEAAFRAEARAWLDANAPHELSQELEDAPFGRLQLKSVDAIAGVARPGRRRSPTPAGPCLHWPKEYGGRGATPIERVIWQQEEGVYGKLSGLFGIGHGMCGPTMMAWAAEEQKRELLPDARRRARRTGASCSPSPRAARTSPACAPAPSGDGDDWVVNGQKIWTSVRASRRLGPPDPAHRPQRAQA